MGIVDVLANDGEGEEAVYAYAKKQRRFQNGTTAIHAIRHLVNPISYQELMGIAMLWVDRSLKLSDKDLRIMERLVKAQNQLNRAGTADASMRSRKAHSSVGARGWPEAEQACAEAY